MGSGGDELLVDDVELIYNARLASLKVQGQEVTGFDSHQQTYEIEVDKPVTLDDIEAVADGKAAIIDKKIEAKEDCQECLILGHA